MTSQGGGSYSGAVLDLFYLAIAAIGFLLLWAIARALDRV